MDRGFSFWVIFTEQLRLSKHILKYVGDYGFNTCVPRAKV